jgi:hypothetical protein
MTQWPIIFLGCSITSDEGYVNYFNTKYNINALNLAVGAGSNQLQSYRLNNLLVKKEIGVGTTLFWQITNPLRQFDLYPAVSGQVHAVGKPYHAPFNWTPEVLQPFNEESIAFLCNAEHLHVLPDNSKFNLQTLVCDIYKWSKLVDEIVVYLGWSFFEEPEIIDQALAVLDDCPNVLVLPREHSVLDYCQNKKWELRDDMHPTRESYIRWAQEVLEPILITKLDKCHN